MTAKISEAKISKDFEKNLEKLEKLVQSLESGSLDLTKSLEKFEQSVSLYKTCKNHIVEVEKKVQILTDSLEEVDFEAD